MLEVTINTLKNELDEELKEQLIEYIQNTYTILKHKYNLKIDSLKKIAFTLDLGIELQLISEKYLDGRRIEYTNNSNTKAMMKVITYMQEGIFYEIIVISLSEFMGIFSKNPNSIQHIMHHEFLHIHEKHYLEEYLYDYRRRKIAPLENIYLPTVFSAFSEYYANKLSSVTVTDLDIESIILNFILNLKNFEKNVIVKKIEYQTRRIDLDTFLFKFFVPYTNSLYLGAAYLLGYKHGLEKTLDLLSSEADKLLQNHTFKETYYELESILITMFNKFPEKLNEDFYEKINDNLVDFYKKMGVLFTFDENINQLHAKIR